MKKKTQYKAAKERLARLVARCDSLWSKAVKVAAGCRCEICGSDNLVQACHIIGRANWATRWDQRNGVCGCYDCHDDKTITDWLEENYPARLEWILREKQKRDSIGDNTQHKDIDLAEVLVRLKGVA